MKNSGKQWNSNPQPRDSDSLPTELIRNCWKTTSFIMAQVRGMIKWSTRTYFVLHIYRIVFFVWKISELDKQQKEAVVTYLFTTWKTPPNTLPDLVHVRVKLLFKTILHKGHFKTRAFINPRLAQSGESLTMHLKVVGSNPTLCKNFFVLNLSFAMPTSQLYWANKNGIKQDIHQR